MSICFLIEVGAAIKDQVLCCRVIGERIAQLLDDPGAGGIPGHVEVEDAPPVMRNDEEAVEHAEGERRHGEEIHGGNGLAVVAQKRSPSLCRLGIARGFAHPAQNSSLGDIESEHLQFTMNTRRAPGWVLGDAEDQLADLLADAFSSGTSSMPREPSPI